MELTKTNNGQWKPGQTGNPNGGNAGQAKARQAFVAKRTFTGTIIAWRPGLPGSRIQQRHGPTYGASMMFA
jgi:hypothetical protein